MGIFKKNVKVVEEIKTEEFLNTETNEVEEWIWVDGFKATERDMTCRGYQYELLKVHNISEDKPVEMCGHGFHLCKTLDDVFNYYDIGSGHRFFRVKALVRKKDCKNYGTFDGNMQYVMRNGCVRTIYSNQKLVARSIILYGELTVDEILEGYIDETWTDEMKKDALEIGIEAAKANQQVAKLTSVGYSETFAKTIVDAGKFDIAYSVGTQEGLSMDMKVWTIYNHK